MVPKESESESRKRGRNVLANRNSIVGFKGAEDFLQTITDLKLDKGEAIDEAVGMWLAEKSK
jgi:hypothetical protein